MVLKMVQFLFLASIVVVLTTHGKGGGGAERTGETILESTRSLSERKQRSGETRTRSVKPRTPLRHQVRLEEKNARNHLPRPHQRLLKRKGTVAEGKYPLLGKGRAAEGLRKKHPLRRSLGVSSVSDSVLALWVNHFASGLSPSVDGANAIAVDGAGNVYVAGYSAGMFSGMDFITIKYNSHGQQLWLATYNGPGNDYDEATAIAVDAAGNVYVTGASYSEDTEEDFATIKYNSNGVLQWVARYNGPADDYDEPVGVMVDGGGFVHVAGVSYGLASDADIAVVKYNPSGVQMWARRYNGPANDADIPVAMGMDPSGSVYVGGTSYRLDTHEDYVLLKYSYVGDLAWVVTYDGTGNDYDAITAMVVDNSGNCYVTGISYNLEFDADYFTIKYTTFGNRLWTSRYAGADGAEDIATGIAIDATRQVFVTGMSWGTTSDDFTTVKYGTTGATRWVRQYNGPANLDDEPTGIAVDAGGNIYITGISYGVSSYEDYATVKYNTEGVQLWVARYSGLALDYDAPTAIALDGSGNVYVTGTSYGTVTDEDIATVKYNTNGVQQWDMRHNGSGNSQDEAVDMAVDTAGNIYVTGTSYNELTQTDYTTVKYNAAGVQQWIARYDGPGKGEDFATAIAVDRFGNVYVTGTSYNDTTGYDVATIKYNTLGMQLWIARYVGIANYVEEGSSITVDAALNVYVAGTRYNPGTGFDFLTLKYNSNGQLQWARFYNGPADSLDQAVSIAVDGSGNVYVTGLNHTITGGRDYATIKYNSAGVQQWVMRYNGIDNGPDEPVKIVVDNAGNPIVTGKSFRAPTLNDYATVKYSTTGTLLWTKYYSGPGAANDVPMALQVDGAGNVYVTGGSTGAGSGLDFATIKYSSSGVQQWVERYNSSENDDDVATALAVDPLGNVYVTGYSFMFDTGYDFATVKYGPNGALKWLTRYDNPGQFGDEPVGIAVDLLGNVIVSGMSETDEGSVYTTVKYEAPLISLSVPGISFGMVDVGCRSVDTLIVRNTALVNSLFISSTSTSQNFTVSPGSFVVAPGDSKKVAIRFAPLASGVHPASILFVHNGISGVDTLAVNGSGTGAGTAILFSTYLGEGWRLFSLPVRVTCPFVVPFSYGFSNQYFRSDTINNGRAYWTKLSDPVMHTTGFAVTADTFQIQAGWNLLGSISVPFATSLATTVPESLLITSFFGYSGSYINADTIHPGFGYWVKARTTGVLYVGGTSPQATHRPVTGPDFVSKLRFINPMGDIQTLLLLDEQDEQRLERYELPPLPPDGGFDVRFASQRAAESIPGISGRRTTIELHSPFFPVTVEWEGSDILRDISILVEGQSYSMAEHGSFPIHSPASIHIGPSKIEERPASFALHQNFPNPFNPETGIRYTLAEEGYVRLVVVNTLGQTVRTLVNGFETPGSHELQWNGENDGGIPVSSGIYLYRLSVTNPASGRVSVDTRKMLLLR